MNDQIPTPFPLDFDALKKGDVISLGQLQEITQEKYGSDAYRFKLMKLSERIQDELDDRGLPVTVASEGGELKILTDPEASNYNGMYFRTRMRQMMRAHRRAMAVERENLTELQKQEHDRRVEVQGRYVGALIGEKEKLAVEACERSVPGRIQQGSGSARPG